MSRSGQKAAYYVERGMENLVEILTESLIGRVILDKLPNLHKCPILIWSCYQPSHEHRGNRKAGGNAALQDP